MRFDKKNRDASGLFGLALPRGLYWTATNAFGGELTPAIVMIIG
jgi:hypothetical protein